MPNIATEICATYFGEQFATAISKTTCGRLAWWTLWTAFDTIAMEITLDPTLRAIHRSRIDACTIVKTTAAKSVKFATCFSGART
jgi:hypothetical protein